MPQQDIAIIGNAIMNHAKRKLLKNNMEHMLATHALEVGDEFVIYDEKEVDNVFSYVLYEYNCTDCKNKYRKLLRESLIIWTYPLQIQENECHELAKYKLEMRLYDLKSNSKSSVIRVIICK